jgi:Zn-dependent protease
MGGQAQVGTISGIPIIIDASFLLLFLLWTFSYFTSGSSVALSMGIVIGTGLALSILLHELGHAFSARWFGIGTSHIELNGLGGLCYYDRALPASRLVQIVTAAAGPAVNGLIWLGASYGSEYIYSNTLDGEDAIGWLRVASVLSYLAFANYWLMIFNLLPAFPLDGSRITTNLLNLFTNIDTARVIVGWLGLLVAGYCAWLGINGSMFAFILAFYLFLNNQFVFNTPSGPRWKRWD